ncbi:hypothetical protein COOONC_23159 [Cooperia oncophora]
MANNDGRDAEAKEAFAYVFSISGHKGSGDGDDAYKKFGEEVIQRMKDPPFSCTVECSGPKYQVASTYAGQLHDAFYAYAIAANRTLTYGTQLNDGRSLANHLAMEFQGVSGKVVLGPNGTRYPTFYFDGLNDRYEVESFGTIYVEKLAAGYHSEISSIGHTLMLLLFSLYLRSTIDGKLLQCYI